MRPFYRKRKNIHVRERYAREAPSKRRKLRDRRFVVAYDQEASSESISNSPGKGIKGNKCSPDATLYRGLHAKNIWFLKFLEVSDGLILFYLLDCRKWNINLK